MIRFLLLENVKHYDISNTASIFFQFFQLGLGFSINAGRSMTAIANLFGA